MILEFGAGSLLPRGFAGSEEPSLSLVGWLLVGAAGGQGPFQHLSSPGETLAICMGA